MTEPRPDQDMAEEEPCVTTELAKDNWAKYNAAYKKAVQANHAMSSALQNVSKEHQDALDRTRKVISRRDNRVYQLERENAILLSAAATEPASSRSWETKFKESQQTLEMMTNDNDDLETKCSGLQSTLKAKTERLAEAERERDSAIAQLTDYKTQLANAEKLQKFVNSADEALFRHIEELSRLATIVEAGATSSEKEKYADQTKKLVAAWRRFEPELDKIYRLAYAI